MSLALACAAAGLFTVLDAVRALMNIWQSDALKSMGMIIPFVCFVLILKVWRELGWETGGSWWGFAVLAATALLVFVRSQMLLIVTIDKNWLLQIPPLPLLAVIYATGMVLLFGGRKLLRAAWFPVVLMWAVIPVPQTFSRWVDLPLQHAGAGVARGFAHLIGLQLSARDLNIMFTPQFGMFIAPGCNGMRGAITLGLTAIVVSYVYRFRWVVAGPLVVGAVLLGYVFNLLRLCTLVMFDKFALSFPRMQDHEQLADHIVGGCLFVVALLLFYALVERLRERGGVVEAPVEERIKLGPPTRPYLAKVAAVVVLAVVFGVDAVHVARVDGQAAAVVKVPMPQKLGEYTLVRVWDDTELGGTIVYTWGEYAAADATKPHVSLGISPELGIHDAEVCHIARGEDPTWHGQVDAATAGGEVSLTAATYNDGRVQKLEASTVCDGGACRQYSQSSQHVTLVFARPHKSLPLQADSGRPVPVLLKVESPDAAMPVGAAEKRMAAQLQSFLAGVDLVAVTKPYR